MNDAARVKRCRKQRGLSDLVVQSLAPTDGWMCGNQGCLEPLLALHDKTPVPGEHLVVCHDSIHILELTSPALVISGLSERHGLGLGKSMQSQYLVALLLPTKVLIMWKAEVQSLPTNATPAREWSWTLVLSSPSNLLLLGKGSYHSVSGASSGESLFRWPWRGRVEDGCYKSSIFNKSTESYFWVEAQMRWRMRSLGLGCRR